MDKSVRRVLGVLTLGGGFMGFTITLGQIFSTPQAVLGLVISSGFALMYAWGAWCGLQLLEGAASAMKSGRIFWALQMPVLITPGIAYLFSAGAFLCVGLNFSTQRLFMNWQLGSQFRYGIITGTGPSLCGINLFAIAVVFYFSYRMHLTRLGMDAVAPAPAREAVEPG